MNEEVRYSWRMPVSLIWPDDPWEEADQFVNSFETSKQAIGWRNALIEDVMEDSDNLGIDPWLKPILLSWVLVREVLTPITVPYPPPF